MRARTTNASCVPSNDVEALRVAPRVKPPRHALQPHPRAPSSNRPRLTRLASDIAAACRFQPHRRVNCTAQVPANTQNTFTTARATRDQEQVPHTPPIRFQAQTRAMPYAKDQDATEESGRSPLRITPTPRTYPPPPPPTPPLPIHNTRRSFAPPYSILSRACPLTRPHSHALPSAANPARSTQPAHKRTYQA